LGEAGAQEVDNIATEKGVIATLKYVAAKAL
jgi:hypothetical protein